MKTFLITTAAILATALCSQAKEKQHLFIMSGQSNMKGLDPQSSFTPALEKQFGKENIAVIHDAHNGQPIRQWYKVSKSLEAKAIENNNVGLLYNQLIAQIKPLIKKKDFESITFLWMQGERDARESLSDVYAESLKGLIQKLENDLGRDDINTVIGRLSDFDLENKKYPHWTKIRDIQEELAEADPTISWVDTDDLNDGLNDKKQPIKNDLHYSVEGYKVFGERLAKKSIQMITTEERNKAIRLWSIDQIGGEENKLKEETEYRREGKITYRNIKDPNLTFYPAKTTSPAPTVLYCPGGGYKQVSVLQPHIDWLNNLGYNVFVLKYSVPNMRDAAYRDAQRAMRLIRYNAKKWNVDPKNIGVLGGSAGGHLVARLSQNYPTPAYEAIDDADKQSCEPNFVILVSGAYFGIKNKSSELAKELFHMKHKVAPTFLVYAKDDERFVNGGITYAKALKDAGKKAEIVLFEKGGHGLTGVNWYPDCEKWLTQIGITSKK